jgi:hypothetical protein
MATFRELSNQASNGRHLGPGGMAGVFKQQPVRNITTKVYSTENVGSCGAVVVLQANTTANAVIMARGECGLSGVVCAACAPFVESEDEPGLAVRG